MTKEQWDELFAKVHDMPVEDLEKIIVDSARKAGALQTNYDRLVSKTPEELAKTIVGWLADAAELCGENRQEFNLTQAEEYTVSWLKAPAEEKEG